MSKKSKTKITDMVVFTMILMILSCLFSLLYQIFRSAWLLSVFITMLTIFYHFAMRLIVGETVSLLYRGKDFPEDRLGFQIHDFEKRLYERIKVKKWKRNMITAKPELFDLEIVKPEELLHNVMQAELVHRVIVILSYVPVFFIIPFGEPVVFIITSVLASLVDLQFVMIQRYNRPRVKRYISLMKKRHENNN